MEIKMGKFTKVSLRSRVVGPRSFQLVMESSQVDQLSINSNVGLVDPISFVPSYALESAITFLFLLVITTVLSVCASTKICLSVVQGVVIAMVALIGTIAFKNQSVHGNADALPISFYTSPCVETFCLFLPRNMPVKRAQPFEILSVYFCIPILRKGNELVRLILRLSNCVSFHAARVYTCWHVPTPNRNLLLSHLNMEAL